MHRDALSNMLHIQLYVTHSRLCPATIYFTHGTMRHSNDMFGARQSTPHSTMLHTLQYSPLSFIFYTLVICHRLNHMPRLGQLTPPHSTVCPRLNNTLHIQQHLAHSATWPAFNDICIFYEMHKHAILLYNCNHICRIQLTPTR